MKHMDNKKQMELMQLQIVQLVNSQLELNSKLDILIEEIDYINRNFNNIDRDDY